MANYPLDMKLSDFLKQPDKTATDLASAVKCEVSTITRLARGERSPSLALALRIEEATGGLVKPADLIFTPSEDDASRPFPATTPKEAA